jgi:DnaK suppressor protein
MKTQRRLTPSQRNALQRSLIAKRDEVQRFLTRLEEEARDAVVDSAELEDVAQGVTDDRSRAAIGERERTLLGEIDHALSKFAGGTYGLSEATHRPIPLERLRSVPWARFAADEEERVERGLSLA